MVSLCGVVANYGVQSTYSGLASSFLKNIMKASKPSEHPSSHQGVKIIPLF